MNQNEGSFQSFHKLTILQIQNNIKIKSALRFSLCAFSLINNLLNLQVHLSGVPGIDSVDL
jgi:hypothetical protein